MACLTITYTTLSTILSVVYCHIISYVNCGFLNHLSSPSFSSLPSTPSPPAPKPTVQLISTQYHLPTHSSFNTATITCIASLQLGQSDRLDYPKVFTWSSNGTPINDASSPTNTYNTSSESMIQRTYTIAGVYSYTCNVSVSVPGDPLAFSYDTIMITATGE